MTISIDQAGRLKTEKTKLTTTLPTSVYLAKDRSRPVVVGIRITNSSAGAVTAAVALYDAAAVGDFPLTGTVSIAANDTLELSDMPLALLDNDAIKVTAGTANALDVVVTALEGVGR